jgi:NADH dehydrogenase
MLRKIAIVGGNGFVGRHVVELAVRRGLEAVGIVRSKEGAEVVQSLGGAPLRLSSLNPSEAAPLASGLWNCDGLVYTASVTAGAGDPDRTDPRGFNNVLAACRAEGVPRVVFFSGLGVARYGMKPHCTNSYFLAKMTGEVTLFRSGLAATVFRPSYIFGPGDEFLTPLIRRIARGGVIEIAGDGGYRLQPVAVRDAARAALGALDGRETLPRVIDLVGPEVLSYRDLVGRIASLLGRAVEIRERPVEEALALARASDYFGLRPHDLACLLCDEVSDPSAVSSLVGERLETLDRVIAETIAASDGSGTKP